MKRRKLGTPIHPRDSSSSPAAGDPRRPRWVILNCYGCGVPGEADGDRVIADAKTVAESCTSTGRHFVVSMGIAPPPAFSYLNHAMVGSARSPVKYGDDTGFSRVVAAHRDSVLFLMTTKGGGTDYFVYDGACASRRSLPRPPRLTLLPERQIPRRRHDDDDSVRALNLSDTGLLRRGDDELLVAQLEAITLREPRDTADLRVLRLGGRGGGGWELNKAVPIVQNHGGGKLHVLPDWWEAVGVIPVGDRYLCWLNYLAGLLVCDMADKASHFKLRYVRLPAKLVGDYDDDYDYDEANGYTSSNDDDPPSMKYSRNMCAAGAGAVRLVSVDSRCCCGGRLRVRGGSRPSTCKRSRFAFTVTTWTLKLRTMTWVQDGVWDCDELWRLPEYRNRNLPRVPLEYPVVSSDDPDVVCFRVRNDYSCYLDDDDRKVWLLEVDTRRKRLRSVIPTTIPYWKEDSDNIQTKFHC
ncbi:hypothetical protein BDA96_05G060000 [Sorghum bicolor]|uniref:DUF1618 domain-containing protein n=1 Tax=Sorghum bicolor TaxID=4558 RepID=A0A921QWH8_SORBI|nr:hypothetical protein BDA96_05G060000 [Sorghum bicolor]